MTCDGGWPDSYSAGEYSKLEAENRRLRTQVERLGGSTVELTGELPVDHPLKVEVERLRRLEGIAWDHVEAFKALMVDAQEKRESLEDELAASRSIRKRQGAIIAKLEEKLGIDREL